MPLKATNAQVKKVQVVYGQMASREIGVEKSREARMAWASQTLGRNVESFSELSRAEAIRLIDAAQGSLCIPYVAPNPRTREQARRTGLDGRKDVDHEFTAMPQLVSDEDMRMIHGFVERLGWDTDRFRAWLASPRSPFAQRDSKDIKTTADANQVRWALKRMLQRNHRWGKDAA